MRPNLPATDAEATLPPSSPPGEAATLPPATSADGTATLPPADPFRTVAPYEGVAVPAPSSRETIPGYEILGELGRGGMGVVYKARQVKADRLVALKMILAGGHAGEAELARFRTEGEAIARLQHPNIVQVYEVGEHEGRPFFSLEFCTGGSLDRRLDGTPLPPREAARLVETLARGMSAAHRAKVIHRDLKPANVLLTADGTPKITDFGLAKKMDDQGQTQSGSIMGTPSYMAPEQAGGKSKDMGPAADIYALGAILYELLTGRPPFKAATPLDTILQVVADEPVPPRQLQSKTPRDLETVCLKCLAKEPGRRYATAEALADDLRRYQGGEPIAARPVGCVERAAKWVRRNPAVAGLAALVFVALAGGTTVSTLFALDAGVKAKLAEDNARTAQDNAKTAEDNAKRAEDEKRETAKALDKVQTTLARSLIRPLALQGGDRPMTIPEWEALWELAGSRPGRVGYHFVEDAIRKPVTVRQLRDRAALALDAAVGLDVKRRDEVERLLLSRLGDATLADEQQSDLARGAAEWGALSSSGALQTARKLIQPIEEPDNVNHLPYLAPSLASLAARMGPKDAAEAAAMLTQAMKDPKNVNHLPALAHSLAALAARMEPKEAAKLVAEAAASLTQAMKDLNRLPYLAPGLVPLAARMDPKAAAEAAATLTQAMKDPKYVNYSFHLAPSLAALAARMEPQEAAKLVAEAAATLIQAIKDPKNVYYFSSIDRRFARVWGWFSGMGGVSKLEG